MTDKTDIPDRLRRVVAYHLAVDAARVEPDADFADDLGADSLDMVELTMAVEEEFGVEIGDDDAAAIRTVADAQALVERLVAGAAA